MKNLSICFAVIFLFCLSNLLAQGFAQKGIWELGGTINFVNSTSVSNGETAENSPSTFSLNVPVYNFVMDGLALGLIPQFQNLSSGGRSASLFALLAGIAYNLKTQSAAIHSLKDNLALIQPAMVLQEAAFYGRSMQVQKSRLEVKD